MGLGQWLSAHVSNNIDEYLRSPVNIWKKKILHSLQSCVSIDGKRKLLHQIFLFTNFLLIRTPVNPSEFTKTYINNDKTWSNDLQHFLKTASTPLLCVYLPPSPLNDEVKMAKPPITLLYSLEHLNANVISSHA